MIEWQPIETAPRTEAVILAWDGFNVFQCYWYGQHRFGETAELHRGRPWISHWMPLPAPPEPAP